MNNMLATHTSHIFTYLSVWCLGWTLWRFYCCRGISHWR